MLLFDLFADGDQILQPLVQVQCSAHISNDTSEMQFSIPNDRLRHSGQNAMDDTQPWHIPRNYTDMSATDLLSYPMNLYWAKLSTEYFDQPPTAGLVFVMPDDNHTKSVVSCSILAHWVPGSILMMPTVDRNIHLQIPDPLETAKKYHTYLSATKYDNSDPWDSIVGMF